MTYSNAAKHQMLGVSPESLEQFGAVSEAVAKEMAFGAIANSQASAAVSITGIAGPGGGSDEKPVGLVWFGAARLGEPLLAIEKRFGDLGRAEIRQLSVQKALELLLSTLKGSD